MQTCVIYLSNSEQGFIAFLFLMASAFDEQISFCSFVQMLRD